MARVINTRMISQIKLKLMFSPLGACTPRISRVTLAELSSVQSEWSFVCRKELLKYFVMILHVKKRKLLLLEIK